MLHSFVFFYWMAASLWFGNWLAFGTSTGCHNEMTHLGGLCEYICSVMCLDGVVWHQEKNTGRYSYTITNTQSLRRRRDVDRDALSRFNWVIHARWWSPHGLFWEYSFTVLSFWTIFVRIIRYVDYYEILIDCWNCFFEILWLLLYILTETIKFQYIIYEHYLVSCSN